MTKEQMIDWATILTWWMIMLIGGALIGQAFGQMV